VTFEISPVFVTADYPGHAGMVGGRGESPRLPCWREGGPGDQTWGARHDPGFASPGPVGQRHRPAGRCRPKDRQDPHRQRTGAAGLQEARAAAECHRSLIAPRSIS
jgi:hypothetical protein